MKPTQHQYGYLGQQSLPEEEEYQELLRKNGIPYEEREIVSVGTFLSPLVEVSYRNPDGQDRYVYILTSGGADYSGQTCYAFAQRVPDEQVADLLASLRKKGEA